MQMHLVWILLLHHDELSIMRKWMYNVLLLHYFSSIYTFSGAPWPPITRNLSFVNHNTFSIHHDGLQLFPKAPSVHFFENPFCNWLTTKPERWPFSHNNCTRNNFASIHLLMWKIHVYYTCTSILLECNKERK